MKQIIGKKVRLAVDYTRDVNMGTETSQNTYCSAWLGDVNVNEMMVEQ